MFEYWNVGGVWEGKLESQRTKKAKLALNQCIGFMGLHFLTSSL
jgi:hypothetical protein